MEIRFRHTLYEKVIDVSDSCDKVLHKTHINHNNHSSKWWRWLTQAVEADTLTTTGIGYNKG